MNFGEAKYVTFGLADFGEVDHKPSIMQKFSSYFKAPKCESKNQLATNQKSETLEPPSADTFKSDTPPTTAAAVSASEHCPTGRTSSSSRTMRNYEVTPTASVRQVASAVATTPTPRSTSNVRPTSLTGNLQQLSDRRYWMLDENCRYCFECGCRFTTIRRKHHCRVCGRIFCHQCSNQVVDGYRIGMSGLQRACIYCAYTLMAAPESLHKTASRNSSVPLPSSTVRPYSITSSTLSPTKLSNLTGNSRLQEARTGGENEDMDFRQIERDALFASRLPATASGIRIGSDNPLVMASEDMSPHHGGTASHSITSLRHPKRVSREELQHSVDWLVPAVRHDSANNSLSSASTISTHRLAISAREPRPSVTGLSRHPAMSVSLLQSPSGATETLAAAAPLDGQQKLQLQSLDATHFSDSKLLTLWLSMVSGPLERGIEAIGYPSESADDNGELLSITGLSAMHNSKQRCTSPLLNQADLQIVSVVGSDQRTVIYYAFGFHLVYWLVSNVPELGRSR